MASKEKERLDSEQTDIKEITTLPYAAVWLLLNWVMCLIHSRPVPVSHQSVIVDGHKYDSGHTMGPTIQDSIIHVMIEHNFTSPGIHGSKYEQKSFKIKDLKSWINIPDTE